jgi:uncharacterized membrane protein
VVLLSIYVDKYTPIASLRAVVAPSTASDGPILSIAMLASSVVFSR